MLRGIIAKEAMRFLFFAQSDFLAEEERRQYKALIHTSAAGIYTMLDVLLKDSLLLLSSFLYKHYGKKSSYRLMNTTFRLIKRTMQDILTKW